MLHLSGVCAVVDFTNHALSESEKPENSLPHSAKAFFTLPPHRRASAEAFFIHKTVFESFVFVPVLRSLPFNIRSHVARGRNY